MEQLNTASGLVGAAMRSLCSPRRAVEHPRVSHAPQVNYPRRVRLRRVRTSNVGAALRSSDSRRRRRGSARSSARSTMASSSSSSWGPLVGQRVGSHSAVFLSYRTRSLHYQRARRRPTGERQSTQCCQVSSISTKGFPLPSVSSKHTPLLGRFGDDCFTLLIQLQINWGSYEPRTCANRRCRLLSGCRCSLPSFPTIASTSFDSSKHGLHRRSQDWTPPYVRRLLRKGEEEHRHLYLRYYVLQVRA